jgi:hypothetical protein
MFAKTVIVALAVSGLGGVATAEIRPTSDGMFLCPTPASANYFWADAKATMANGVSMTRAIATQIATKNECHFVRSNSLKPVDYRNGQLAISDGSATGWAAPETYVIYINNTPAR